MTYLSLGRFAVPRLKFDNIPLCKKFTIRHTSFFFHIKEQLPNVFIAFKEWLDFSTTGIPQVCAFSVERHSFMVLWSHLSIWRNFPLSQMLGMKYRLHTRKVSFSMEDKLLSRPAFLDQGGWSLYPGWPTLCYLIRCLYVQKKNAKQGQMATPKKTPRFGQAKVSWREKSSRKVQTCRWQLLGSRYKS